MTDAAIFGFLMVFIRCSAMFLSSPLFSAQTTPLFIRILTGVSVSAALTSVVHTTIGPVPSSMWQLVYDAGSEAVAGLLIGSMVSIALQALTIAGGIMDIQTGLGSSHVLNPLNGVQSTVLSHLQSMLAVVVFLCVDAHHLLLRALVNSYAVIPSFGTIHSSLIEGITQMSMLALQIAAPVMAVGLIMDAALALLSRAVPQMQAMQVGNPAKIGVGLATVSLGLPMAVVGVNSAVGVAFNEVGRIFHH